MVRHQSRKHWVLWCSSHVRRWSSEASAPTLAFVASSSSSVHLDFVQIFRYVEFYRYLVNYVSFKCIARKLEKAYFIGYWYFIFPLLEDDLHRCSAISVVRGVRCR